MFISLLGQCNYFYVLCMLVYFELCSGIAQNVPGESSCWQIQNTFVQYFINLNIRSLEKKNWTDALPIEFYIYNFNRIIFQSYLKPEMNYHISLEVAHLYTENIIKVISLHNYYMQYKEVNQGSSISHILCMHNYYICDLLV